MVRSHSKRHHKQKKSADWRLRLIAAIFLLLFTSILGVLLELQVIHHATLSVQAEEQRIVQRVIPARRGDILASDGLPLAQNVTLNLIYAVPWMVEEPAAAALQLSPLLNIPVDELHEKLSRQSSYVPLKHWVEETEAEAVRQLKLKGIVITGEEKRYYPEGRMLSHVLGFTNSEGIGQYGLEKYYDPLLKGKEGYLRREQDTSGRSIPIGLNEEIPPVDGVHIVLTIDRSVQRIVEAKLKKGVERVSAEQGSVIVMDPLTGAVLAMANYPDFDPNNYVESLKDAEGNIQEHAYAVFNNDAVSWPYEPGSVFKVITMAAALDSGKVKVDATFFDSGSLGVGGLTIVNWDRLGHGELSLSRCLEISNNVCLAQVALATEGSNFYRYIQGFGFGSTTGIDLPYELGGTILFKIDASAADIEGDMPTKLSFSLNPDDQDGTVERMTISSDGSVFVDGSSAGTHAWTSTRTGGDVFTIANTANFDGSSSVLKLA
ncbi:MAG TPA: penicillin-binding protein 2, partial [bacterium]|nr:penicillin-binding protein 2 [bacterium]